MVIVDILKRLNLIPVPLVDVQGPMCRARAILAANRLGVFKAIEESKKGLSAKEVTQRTGIAPNAAEVLLEALRCCGYLRKRGESYRNGRWVKRWLLDPRKGISHYLLVQLHGWYRLSELDTVLKTGHPAADYHAMVADPSEKQEIYTKAMLEVARFLVPAFLKRVNLPPRVKRILDIGGAHGLYAKALVEKYPHLEATVFDLPGPVTTAAKFFQKSNNPIRFIAGDIFKDDIGKDWDVVLLINMIHLFDPNRNRQILKKVYASLAEGGVLLIVDQFMGISRLHDRICGLMGLSYLTVGGKCYHRKEVEGMLRSVGFNRMKVKLFIRRAPTALIEAWK